jgi:hypothetical protein
MRDDRVIFDSEEQLRREAQNRALAVVDIAAVPGLRVLAQPSGERERIAHE